MFPLDQYLFLLQGTLPAKTTTALVRSGNSLHRVAKATLTKGAKIPYSLSGKDPRIKGTIFAAPLSSYRYDFYISAVQRHHSALKESVFGYNKQHDPSC